MCVKASLIHMIVISAMASLWTTPSMAEGTTISPANMDFSSTEGLEAALDTIEQAALEVCEEEKPVASYEREFMSDCQRQTVRQVVAEINDERLTSYHENESSLRAVDRTKKFFDRFRD